MTSIVLIYWWDWTEFISNNVVSNKREFAIDFLILIILEFLFGYFDSPLHLSLILLILGCLDMLWVVNHLYQFPELFRLKGKKWITEKILDILIYAFCLGSIYLTRNVIPVWAQGGIIIFGFVIVRNFGFSQVRNTHSIRSLLRKRKDEFQFRKALPKDATNIIEINNDYLNIDDQNGFLIIELDVAEVESDISAVPAA